MAKSLRRLGLVLTIGLTLVAVGDGCIPPVPVPTTIDYAAAKAPLDPYRAAVTEIIGLLDQGKGEDAKLALDDLHGAVVATRALLTGTHFSGDSQTLTDPFSLPAGSYRVHLQSAGYVIVKATPVSAPQNFDILFNVGDGEATDGISTLYASNGERITLEFYNISAPYEVWFEEIR